MILTGERYFSNLIISLMFNVCVCNIINMLITKIVIKCKNKDFEKTILTKSLTLWFKY